MADSRLSHRTNIQFCVKLGKWAKDTYAKLLKEAFEEDSCSYSTVKDDMLISKQTKGKVSVMNPVLNGHGVPPQPRRSRM